MFTINATSNKRTEAIRIGNELSRHCAGRNENGAAVSLRALPTAADSFYVAAEKPTDKACIVITDIGDGYAYDVVTGTPVDVSRMLSTGRGGELRGRVGFGDNEHDAVAFWQQHR